MRPQTTRSYYGCHLNASNVVLRPPQTHLFPFCVTRHLTFSHAYFKFAPKLLVWPPSPPSHDCSEIEFKKGDATLLPKQETFDIILANINKNILKQDLPNYFTCLKKGGYILLSGFFSADVEELKKLAQTIGFTFKESYNKNEWAVIKLVK